MDTDISVFKYKGHIIDLCCQNSLSRLSSLIMNFGYWMKFLENSSKFIVMKNSSLIMNFGYGMKISVSSHPIYPVSTVYGMLNKRYRNLNLRSARPRMRSAARKGIGRRHQRVDILSAELEDRILDI